MLRPGSNLSRDPLQIFPLLLYILADHVIKFPVIRECSHYPDKARLHSITDEREIKVLFEIMEKRSELGNSTIICSQREPKSWTAMIYNDEVASNALLKRATKHFTVVIAPRI
ncbi:MAG: ATP-binding protein [Clostridia bacterium]|nr:ATP-binding protein [Clostridia bacterium]